MREYARALISIVTSGVAAGLSRGEIEARPYVQAVTVDAAGLGLTEELMGYGEAARDLHVRVDDGVAP